MNTKEKARELVEKFKKNSSTTINDEVFADYDRLNGKIKRTFTQVLNHSNLYHAKQCALIAQKNLVDKLRILGIIDNFEEDVLKEIELL